MANTTLPPINRQTAPAVAPAPVAAAPAAGPVGPGILGAILPVDPVAAVEARTELLNRMARMRQESAAAGTPVSDATAQGLIDRITGMSDHQAVMIRAIGDMMAPPAAVRALPPAPAGGPAGAGAARPAPER